jgi:hypothetical protein
MRTVVRDALRLRLQREQIEIRLSKLTDLLIDGSMERSVYENKTKSTARERQTTDDQSIP